MTGPPKRSETPATGAGAGRARRQALIWAGVIVVALVVTAGGALPTPLARHLLADHLADLGITAEGLETLDVALLEGRATLGPLRLRHPEVDPVTVTRAEIDLGLAGLLAGRLVVERLLLHGLDLAVRSDASGQFVVNGYPVLAPGGPPVRGLLGGRIPGAERIEAREVTLRYETAAGGRIALEVDRFSLTGLHGWQAETPAAFELTGRVNEVAFAWSGQISPFAEEPVLTVDSVIEGVEIERIESLIGARGLGRLAGAASFRGRHEGRLSESGAITVRTRGKLLVADLDVRRDAGTALAASRMEADVDLRQDHEGGSRWRLSGGVRLDARTVALTLPDGAEFVLGSLGLELEDVEAGIGSDGNLSARWRTSIDAHEGAFSGRIQVSVDLLIEVVRALQHLGVAAASDEVRTGLEGWAGRSATTPLSDVHVDRLRVRDSGFEYAGGTGTFTIALDTTAELARIRVRARRQRTDVETLTLSLESLRLQSSRHAVLLEGNVAARAVAVASTRRGGRARVGSMAVRLERLRLRSEAEGLFASFSGLSEMRDIEGGVDELQGIPLVSYDIEATRLRIDEAIIAASPQGADWGFKGQAEADDATLDAGRGLVVLAAIDRAALRDVEIDESLRVHAADAVLSGSSFGLPLSVLLSVISGDLHEHPRALARSVAPAAAPEGTDILIEDVQWLLAELGHDPSARDGVMGPNTAAAIETYQGAAGLPVDGRATTALRDALEAAARPPSAAAESPAEQPMTFEIARLSASEGARVLFVDDTVEPEVGVSVFFDTLSLTNLNTRDTDQPTEIRATAAVNEFSRLEADGRVTPFKRPPEADLQLRVSSLELSPYSPYLAGLTGVAVNEGVLDLQSEARISGGAIDGQVTIDLRRLEVQTVSEEDAQRAAHAIGVPVETAFRLLEDAEGHIELTIPISGTLEEPQADVSDAVSRAVVGVLAAVFPPNIIAGMFAGEADEVEFEPLVFAPNSAALDAAASDHLDRIARLMAEHASVVISVCGRAVAGDTDSLAAMLSARLEPAPAGTAPEGEVQVPDWMVASWASRLAVDRARAARRYLIDERGIAPEMIVECRSSFDPDDGGPPRVEISM